MIAGISLDTAYLLNQTAPFPLNREDTERLGIKRHNLCFEIGRFAKDPKRRVGVLFKFDLCSASTLQRSFKVTQRLTSDGNLLLVFTPSLSPVLCHQLFFTPSNVDSINRSYCYKLAKPLHPTKVRSWLTSCSSFAYNDVGSPSNLLALVQTQGSVPYPVSYSRMIQPSALMASPITPNMVDMLVDNRPHKHTVLDAHYFLSDKYRV